GWEDFRTAFWLKRHDPYRPRGRACRALYFAYGLCKVALMAMALLLIFSIVEGVGARQGQPAQANPVLDLPFLTAIFGCWLLAVISCWAFWLAFYYGFRLWLHPGVHSDRRQQRWPPGGDYRPADNRVGCLLFFGLFFVFFHVIIILLIMLLMPGNGLV